MHRSVAKIAKESFKQAKYLPDIIGQFKNWFSFLLNFLRVSKNNDRFILRNGLVIIVDRSNDDGWSPSVLMDVLIKKDYGDIKDNSVIVDIGANFGAFSLFATYNKNNVCYSFEPEDVNFNVLRRNIETNGLAEQIKPFKCAVSNINGQMKLYKTISMSHSLNVVSDNFFLVDTVTIEKIFEENKLTKIDYLKIDCEGGEYNIFYNCAEKIFDRIDNILLEYHNFKNSEIENGDALIGFLKKNGYNMIYHNRISNELGIVHFSHGK